MTNPPAPSDGGEKLHTPGPWNFTKAKYPQDGEYDYAIGGVVDGVRYVIAEAFGRVSEGVRPNTEANARLIASAPSLLQALEEAREALELFAKAASVCDDYPGEMAALRATFDFPMRSLGRDNCEIEGHDSIRVYDLRRARATLAKIDAAIQRGKPCS